MEINNRFESVTAFSAWLANHEPAGYFKENPHRIESNGESDKKIRSSGTKNFEEANELLLYGWKEGAERVKNIMLKTSPVSAQSTYSLSPVGFMPMTAPALAGSPRNMLRKKTVHTPARVVTLAYNVSIDFSVKAEDIEKTAAALFNVIYSLEHSGVRVELFILFASEKYKDKVNAAIKIKSAGQPFNLLSMVYPVVHPSFLRRHLFAHTERTGVTTDWGNYGYVVTDPKEVKKVCEALRIKTDNILDYYTLSGKTEEEIIKMIK